MALLEGTKGEQILVLVVEDDEAHAELIQRAFQDEHNVKVLVTGSVAAARQLIAEKKPDIVLADLMLSDGRGTDLLRPVEGHEPPALVLLTSHGDERVAVEAMKAGALDYVVKSTEILRAAPSIVARALREWSYVVDRRRAEEELRAAVDALRELHRITSSPRGFEDNLREVLKFGCETLGLTTGVLIRIGKEDCELGAMYCTDRAPAWLVDKPLDHAWCVLDPDGSEPLCVDDLEASGFRGHPLFQAHGVRAYAGINIQLGKASRGSLAFFGGHVLDAPFNATATEVLKLMSQWVAAEFLRQETSEALRQAERRFQQAQRLEAVARLASGVAHDYNNLLMGIAGCIDIAKGKIEKNSHAYAYLEEAKEAAHRGSTLTRQLLDFSRRRPSEQAEVNPSAVVERTRRMVESLVGEQISIRFSLRAKEWRVWIDEGQIEQVLMNLVVNARDAMSGGGTLTIETQELIVEDNGPIKPHEIRPGSYVTLSVQDTGCGMTEDVLEQIFTPFFTTKSESTGTGLGLATVKSIVEECGGEVRVQSEVDRGTEFVVYMPRSQRPEIQPAPLGEPLASPGGGEVVLLVEDEMLVRIALRSYLERHGYRVVEAGDMTEALDLVRDHPGSIDLILADMMLPDGSGRDVVREVKRKRPKVRALYMSAHPQQTLVQSGRMDPGTPILQKPFGEEVLLDHVRRVLGRRISQSADDRRGAILVVEDSDLARMAIRDLLSELGRPVLTASRPSDALEQLRDLEGSVSLLLTDYSLPEMTGDRLAREIRREHPDVKVVFMSGREDVPRQAGDLFLQKPVEFDELLRVIEGALV